MKGCHIHSKKACQLALVVLYAAVLPCRSSNQHLSRQVLIVTCVQWIAPRERAKAVSLTTSGMYLGSAAAMAALPSLLVRTSCLPLCVLCVLLTLAQVSLECPGVQLT